ncbi:MAG: vitamin K epoxide reductase family protein [Minisyncoccia bacterium]
MYIEQKSKPSLTPFWLIAVAIAGLGDTFYLSWNKFHNTLPTCSIVHGCDVVLTSKYAEIFGVPLAYIGLVFYIYLLGLAILLAIDPHSRGLRLGTLVYAAIGLLCSCVFAYMWVFLIHALCIYCLTSAILTLIVFLLAVWHVRSAR